MQEIYEGLYAMEEAMPCLPHDIKMGEGYTLAGSLSVIWGGIIGGSKFISIMYDHTTDEEYFFWSKATEEFVVRIIRHSQKVNQWVGVAKSLLNKEIEKDLLMVKDRYRLTLKRAGRMHFWKNLITFGVYELFSKKPPSLCEAGLDSPEIFSGFFLGYGLELHSAVYNLVEYGLFKSIPLEDKKTEILFPTPALASLILKKQKDVGWKTN